MQSWSLRKFYEEKGMDEAMRVMNCTSRTTVYNRMSLGYRIVDDDDGYYEVWRTELKRRVLIDE